MADETTGTGRDEPGTETGSGRSGGDGAAREGPSDGEGGRGRAAWTGLSDLQDTVLEVVDSALRGFSPAGAGRLPRHDLVRVPGEGYVALFDLPGVRKEDLEVSTVGDELTLSGERRRPDLPEGSEALRSERAYGRFRRSVQLPPDVDTSAVKARLEEGVLRITLPRRGGSEAQTIEVEG